MNNDTETQPTNENSRESSQLVSQTCYAKPFYHDKEYDWGIIRDQNQRMIKVVGYIDDELANTARREKFDPLQPEVDFLLSLLNA